MPPPLKRPVVMDEEAIRPTKKQYKTPYFFGPVNTLTGRAESVQAKPQPEANDPTGKSAKAPETVSVSSTASNPDRVGQKQSKHADLDHRLITFDHHSSDDSFEGIRWKTSPRRVLRRDKLPSSPLREPLTSVESGGHSPSPDVFGPVPVVSVLNKYGQELHNILSMSQAPNLKRTRSELSPSHSSSLPNTLEKSPTLSRAKSSGVDFLLKSRSKVSTQIPSSNKLSTWMDRFEKKSDDFELKKDKRKSSKLLSSSGLTDFSDDHDFLPHIEQKGELQNERRNSSEGVENPANTNIHGGDAANLKHTATHNQSSPSPADILDQSTQMEDLKIVSELSDDPFSDNDEELLRVLSQLPERASTPSVSSENAILTPYDVKSNKKAISTEIEATLTNQTSSMQNAPVQTTKLTEIIIEDDDFASDFSDSSVENAPITSLNRHDLVHAKSFQKSISNFEKLRVSPAEKEESNTKLAYSRPDLKRFQIKGIIRQRYSTDKEQLILTLVDDSGSESKVVVRGEYTELEFEIKDLVHIIITDPANTRLIDDSHNLLVWNPDTLLSATVVSQQLTCPRRTVIQSRFKFPGASSLPIIIGEIVHAIFQSCFVSERWSMFYLCDLLEENLTLYMLAIFSLGDKVDEVRSEVKEKHLPMIENWFGRFYKSELSSKNQIPAGHNETIQLSVSSVLDIEESIWSPTFGLKGNVDATIEATIMSSERGKYLLPLEIKSGKSNISHQGQASLYSLLYKDRYDIDVRSFLLVYTKEMITKKCDISVTDLKALLNLRNRLTKYFKVNSRELPPLLQRSTCDFCGIQSNCMTINELQPIPEDSGLPAEVYSDLTKQLEGKPRYREFYNFWDTLLVKEESVAAKTLKLMWTLTAKEREETGGLAIGELIIKNSNDKSDLQTSFIYIFERRDLGLMPSTHIVKNDRVIVSDESGHFAIARGQVKSIGPKTIVVSTSRRIIGSDLKRVDFSKKNQVFQSVLQRSESQANEKSFRLDKDEISSGMGLARFNILNLFTAEGDSKRRELIVDLKRPTFQQKPLPYTSSAEKFNPDQVAAFDKVLSANDCALILGMPGTGKTTVIAELIKFIVENGKTVLLTSYTHSAVDNILLKVTSFGINILRVGYKSRIHKDIHQFVPDETIKTYDQYLQTYMEPKVVACTCLGITDVAFSLRAKFDYCIVDEASQVSMPISLGPIGLADKFVLVGDHLQLPPLVTHADPEVKRGLSQSLFKILAESCPESLVELTYQYRMCSEIMQLSNVLIYNGRLKCGSKEVAEQELVIPSPENLERHISDRNGTPWLHTVLEPQNKVLFLDHDLVPATEVKRGDKVDNPVEADLVFQTVEGLLSCGVKESQIGVISFNRAQLRLLQTKLASRSDIEILTADQYQGRDKECIIISLVRSNEDNHAGDLVREWRRVNVAITRAKSKLVIFGSRSTLSSADTIKSFVDLLEDRGWMYTLDAGSDNSYRFLSSSQVPQFASPAFSKLFKNSPVTTDVLNNMK